MAKDGAKQAGPTGSTSTSTTLERLASLRREKARLEESLSALEREIETLETTSEAQRPEGKSDAGTARSDDQRPDDPSAKKEAAERAADRSTWSPKLRKLIEEKFPEEGREERIRRATERPFPRIKVDGLTREELRYFAEDVDLEYDV